MEHVYQKPKFRLLYTKEMDLKQYYQTYFELLSPYYRIRKKGESLKALLAIDNDDEYIQLKQRMDPNKAKYVYVPRTYVPRRRFSVKWPLYEFPSFDTPLVTLNNLRKESRLEKYNRLNSMKYSGKIVLEVEKSPEDSYRTRNLLPLKEYLVCLRVENLYKQAGGTRKYKVSQELWIPGSILLERIKDRIICEEDYALANPLIDAPHQCKSKRKMDVNKYGMFYIGKDFYIDNRWGVGPGYDYSLEVREWMKSKNLDPGSVKSMNNTRLFEIPLRIGYPYLFKHQGKCEHLITITDSRLLKPTDILFLEDYPLLKSFASPRGKYCVMCLSRLAKLCVKDCDMIPYDTAFICNLCALSFLYDSQGKKKTSFTMYKYIDSGAII